MEMDLATGSHSPYPVNVAKTEGKTKNEEKMQRKVLDIFEITCQISRKILHS